MKTESKKRYMIVLSTTVLTFIIFYLKPTLRNLPSHSIAEVLGETFGIIAITYAISWGLESRINKYLPDMNTWRKKYRNTFLITWLIFISMNLLVYLNDPDQQSKIKEGFEYSPPRSAFRVEFTGKPTIKETTSLINGEKVTSETAELTTGNCFQRTELCLIDQARSSSYNKDQLFDLLIQFSELNGLSYPEFNYEENEFGKTASMRGYKTISERKVTYLMKVFILNTTLFIISVGCPSEEYPTNEISSFLNSISLKK